MKDIPRDARPREKLLALGPAALADVELIALLLRTGFKGHGVLQLAASVLGHFGGYAGVVRALGSDWLLFDFNHPLAGSPVTFEVQLIGVL